MVSGILSVKFNDMKAKGRPPRGWVLFAFALSYELRGGGGGACSLVLRRPRRVEQGYNRGGEGGGSPYQEAVAQRRRKRQQGGVRGNKIRVDERKIYELNDGYSSR